MPSEALAEEGCQNTPLSSDASINVRIPYDLAGTKGVHECSMAKLDDGTFNNQL